VANHDGLILPPTDGPELRRSGARILPRSYHRSRKMTTKDLRRAQSEPIVRTLSVVEA
jgi:hypothetical protein